MFNSGAERKLILLKAYNNRASRNFHFKMFLNIFFNSFAKNLWNYKKSMIWTVWWKVCSYISLIKSTQQKLEELHSFLLFNWLLKEVVLDILIKNTNKFKILYNRWNLRILRCCTFLLSTHSTRLRNTTKYLATAVEQTVFEVTATLLNFQQ